MINDFSICPARYKAIWLDGVPNVAGEAAMIGTLFHDWATEFFDIVERDAVESMFTIADLTAYFRAASVDEGWSQSLLDCIYNYIDFEVDHIIRLRDLFKGDNEQVWSYFIPYEREFKWESSRSEGTIDRIDLLTDGNLLIWEYKTSRRPQPTAHRRDVTYYATECNHFEIFGDKKVTLGGVMWVRVPQFWTFDFHTRTIQAINKRIRDMNKCKKDNYYPCKVTSMCIYCPKMKLCPAIIDGVAY